MSDLVVGDVHLNEVYSEFFRCILFPFLQQVSSSKSYDRVIFIGDIFDSSTINNDTSKLFKDLLSIYENKEIVILNGNHDKINNNDSIYDILMLPDNVTVYKNVQYEGNHIYIPHIGKSVSQHSVFSEINEYIRSNNLKEVYLYSHNDFSDIYKFKNNFFNVASSFENINVPIYLINGHNHVPVFKKSNNLYIFNTGCSLNTNFNDTGLYNYFLIIDENVDDIHDKFDLFINKNSIHYHTFHIWKDSHIYESCNKIQKENYTFLKFKIHDPSIVLDANFKNKLQEDYKIIDILVDYEIDDLLDINKYSKEDSTSLTELCEKLNITVEEFALNKNDDYTEKVEILFSLLNLMFESRETSPNDINRVITTVKKYMLQNG